MDCRWEPKCLEFHDERVALIVAETAARPVRWP